MRCVEIAGGLCLAALGWGCAEVPEVPTMSLAQVVERDETWPDSTVFLPLNDPVFTDGAVVMNFEAELYTCAPKRHYDGLLVYPVAHHVLSE